MPCVHAMCAMQMHRHHAMAYGAPKPPNKLRNTAVFMSVSTQCTPPKPCTGVQAVAGYTQQLLLQLRV
jgi:hypothetical protein